MLGLRNALIFAALFASSLINAAPAHEDSIVDWDRLSALLDSVDTNVLHNVLHKVSPKFQDGVFSHDRSALEHVHSENPIVATKLVYIARRQNNSTTTTADTSVPPPTTTTVAPSTPSDATAIATVSNGVVFSTTGGGVVTKTSSAATVDFTPSTSTHLFYTTLPNGSIQTSTDLVVVNAPVTATADATGAAAGASTSSAGLQSNAAGPQPTGAGRIGAAFIAGVVGLAAAL